MDEEKSVQYNSQRELITGILSLKYAYVNGFWWKTDENWVLTL